MKHSNFRARQSGSILPARFTWTLPLTVLGRCCTLIFQFSEYILSDSALDEPASLCESVLFEETRISFSRTIFAVSEKPRAPGCGHIKARASSERACCLVH